MSGDLIDTTEMYLRTILELEEESIPALRARIAERLGHSGPTVSQTVARMERDGLLRVAGDRHLELSENGRLLATRVMRKHRLAERHLLDVIGLDFALVHEEACRWEHVISDAVEERIVAILDAPSRSPYGNPIPGRGAIGPSGPEADGVRTLASALAGTGEGSLVVERLTEVIQADAELIALLQEAGVRPGRTVNAELDGTVLRLVGEGGVPHTVEAEVAHHLFVRS